LDLTQFGGANLPVKSCYVRCWII